MSLFVSNFVPRERIMTQKEQSSHSQEKEQQGLVEVLRSYVEDAACIRPRIRSDFEALANAIAGQIGASNRLSPTTLMRLWGYVNEHTKTRISTLNILAQYVGYIDFDSFEKSLKKSGRNVQSGILAGHTLRSSTLSVGDLIEIRWNPDRVIAIRFLGKSRFFVVRSENSKLQVGDTFECPFFVQNEPLFIDHLKHNNQQLSSYVCGRDDGIQYRLVAQK